jgi:hypothetical protein
MKKLLGIYSRVEKMVTMEKGQGHSAPLRSPNPYQSQTRKGVKEGYEDKDILAQLVVRVPRADSRIDLISKAVPNFTKSFEKRCRVSGEAGIR